jgi:DNA mismatch repair protein MutL
MTKRIRVLDDATINKIAAGEVIENPSSVVKELVENALDAGAHDIHIEIQCGGRQLIRVVDNGCGMARDDALLSLERYATSKIRQVEDLTDLLTMGFRGEALPSIAAISKLTLLTSIPGASEGTLILAEGGRLLRCCGAAREPGTTVEIKALFFNVPVRQKFQRSPAYDTTAIQKVVALQSLSHPEVRFTLISDQKSLLIAPAATSAGALDRLRQRVGAVLGADFVDSAMPFEVATDELKVCGLLSLPTTHRPNRGGQYLMINQRAVTSMLVSMAIRDGYGTALPVQRYPAFVLNLTVPGDLLDVNVHPQKSEVRLRNEQALRDFLRTGVSRALQREGPPAFSINVGSMPLFVGESTLPPLPWELSVPSSAKEVAPEARLVPKNSTPQVLVTLPGYVLLDPKTTQHLEADKPGLWILDQRTAHHRILYERLVVQEQSRLVEIEQLFIPMTLPLNDIERNAALEALPELQRLGFQIEPFGPSSLCLRAIPCEFRGIELKDLVLQLVQELRDYQSQGLIHAERCKNLAWKASQAALTRQRQLSLGEASQLVTELFRCENPYQCPHGHVTLTCLHSQRFAKLFQSGG